MKNVLLCTFLCTRNSSGRQVTLGPTSPYNIYIYNHGLIQNGHGFTHGLPKHSSYFFFGKIK